jgi:hypothetical protein
VLIYAIRKNIVNLSGARRKFSSSHSLGQLTELIKCRDSVGRANTGSTQLKKWDPAQCQAKPGFFFVSNSMYSVLIFHVVPSPLECKLRRKCLGNGLPVNEKGRKPQPVSPHEMERGDIMGTTRHFIYRS